MALSDLERAVFGDGKGGDDKGGDDGVVVEWLTRHIAGRLDGELARIVFRSGRLSPVYGVELDDGRRVVIKVHRDPVDQARLDEAAQCQRRLHAAGFPCPEVVDGPATTHGRTAVIESLAEAGNPADAHQPEVRRSMAASLAWQVELLSAAQAGSLAAGAPAWMRYEQGPWPVPHDPMFVWDAPSPGYPWIEELATVAAERLQGHEAPVVTAHSDWVCQNLRFDPAGELVMAYDWDSLTTISEPVLIGAIAACYTEGSTNGAHASTPAEAAQFIADYAAASGRLQNKTEREAAAAASLWTMAYNARCDATFVASDGPADGSPLQLLATYGMDYLRLA